MHAGHERIREALLALLVVVAASRVVLAQDAVIHLAGELDLARLVDLAADRLALNVEYDEKALRAAKVTLRLRDGVPSDELWSLTNALLVSNGFTAVRSTTGDLISIVRLQDAPSRAFVEPEGAAPGRGYRTIAFEPVHRSAQVLAGRPR